MSEAGKNPTLNDIGQALSEANRSVNRGCNYYPPAHVFTHFAMRSAGWGDRSSTTRPDVNAMVRNTPLSRKQIGIVFRELRKVVVEAFSPESHTNLPKDLRRWRRAKVGTEVIREAEETIYLRRQ